jgi:hypothetical protein
MVSDDERLLAELGEAVREAADVPPGLLAAGAAAFAWRTVDAELAALVSQPVTVFRAPHEPDGPLVPRALTFRSGTSTITVELSESALLGQIVPAGPDAIEVRGRDGSVTAVPVDEVGFFALRPPPAGLFRLRLRPASGPAVVTEWMRFD